MPMNRPTATELLCAVREFLERTADADGPAPTYERRVAVNVLKILEREAALGASFAAEERQLLSAHLGFDGAVPDLNAALCDRIAQGREDLRWDELITVLGRIILGKLAVDNPVFAAYRRIIDHQSTPMESCHE
jgi:hypothetical protein